jgi:Tfp pilus assembly protein PilV
MHGIRTAGFALIDVLIALLLLAIALLGACAALVQTLRATHGAMLTTRAVDLVADLGEDLQSVTSITQRRTVFTAWRSRVATELPMAGIDSDSAVSWSRASDSLAATDLVLRWRSTDDGALRELHLPVAATLESNP